MDTAKSRNIENIKMFLDFVKNKADSSCLVSVLFTLRTCGVTTKGNIPQIHARVISDMQPEGLRHSVLNAVTVEHSSRMYMVSPGYTWDIWLRGNSLRKHPTNSCYPDLNLNQNVSNVNRGL